MPGSASLPVTVLPGVGYRAQFSQLFMPQLGLGTHTLKGELARSAVANALRCGYRLVDTATVYKNEQEVGEALRASGLPRHHVFLTSKLSPKEQGPGHELYSV